ncbi:MAG: hypothetical protein Q8N88_04785 [Nanoarchaeota archaeon]|nr:hypothetical protein [Nanoarchaeota archaeon]
MKISECVDTNQDGIHYVKWGEDSGCSAKDAIPSVPTAVLRLK